MSDAGHRGIVDRYSTAVVTFDFDTIEKLQHPDFTERFPQSNELIRGSENFRKVHSNYPGGLPEAEVRRVSGSEDQWVMTPSYTPMRITGSGDVYTMEGRGVYPDGSEWFSVSVIELKQELIYRVTTYFSPSFEAPEWRAAWVEPISQGE